MTELRNEAMLAVEYLAALREAAAIIERLRDDALVPEVIAAAWRASAGLGTKLGEGYLTAYRRRVLEGGKP